VNKFNHFFVTEQSQRRVMYWPFYEAYRKLFILRRVQE